MKLLFYWLSAITVSMILIAGSGVYWLTQSVTEQMQHESAEAVAKAAALSVSAQISMLNKTLDKIAQDPEVLAAISVANPQLLQTVAAKLEKYIPDILKIRILLPGIAALDENSVPRMGFADLDMVRESFDKNQFPGIQGDRGPDRHLAIARRITRDDKTVAVILASFKEQLIITTLTSVVLNDLYIELKQDNLVLASAGDKVGIQPGDLGKIKVSNTDWELRYKFSPSNETTNFVIIACLIIIAVLFSVLAFFVGYRKLSDTLRQDLQVLMKAVKDMMTHSMKGNYPVQLAEMNIIISTLIQYKRVLDSGDRETGVNDKDDFGMNIIVSDDEDFGLDDFFDGSDDEYKL